MAEALPRIVSRRSTRLSPWVELVEREVQFSEGGPTHAYHAIGQADYISIVAVTPQGQVPIVRQYRPSVERFTWELPAGLVEAGEDPAVSCRRELLEETGFPARMVHPLGAGFPCTGRLSNRIHSFFVETGERIPDFQPEAGIAPRLVTPAELAGLIASGEFVSHLHLGALLLAELHSFFTLPHASR